MDILYKNELDTIKIDVPSFGNQINIFREKIMTIFNSIQQNDIKIKYKLENIKNINNTYTFDIFKYLYSNNLLKSLISDNLDDLKTIVNNNDKDGFNSWINYYGNNVMEEIKNLLNKVPDNLVNRHINPELINGFVETNILDFIFNNITHKFITTINYKNITINLKIYGDLTRTQFNDLVLRIILIGLYKSVEEPIVFNIDIYLTDLKKNIKKSLNDKEIILGSRETNSGFAITGIMLCLYRSEELNKVIIHELVHYLELDLGHIQFPNFHKHFNINPNTDFIRINESYTEILGVVINSILTTSNIEDTKYILNYELKYSCYQVAKILQLYGFNNSYDFFYKEYDNNNLFKQNTSILSYFILKTAIMYNLDDFLEKYMNKSEEINSNNYHHYIIKISHEYSYINIINDFITFIRNNEKNNELYLSLRMTCNNN